jgi:hypothetical protein
VTEVEALSCVNQLLGMQLLLYHCLLDLDIQKTTYLHREAIHYGDIIESSLPLITEVKVFEPLEDVLDRAAPLFKERMGRFMQ